MTDRKPHQDTAPFAVLEQYLDDLMKASVMAEDDQIAEAIAHLRLTAAWLEAIK